MAHIGAMVMQDELRKAKEKRRASAQLDRREADRL